MKTTMSLVLGLALAGVSPSWANDTKDLSLQKALSKASAAELPAKAAEIVKAAKSRDRGFVTVGVVKTAVVINAVAAVPVVSAIARAVPDMASIAASAAAEEQPAKAVDIAKAAAAAAPSRAGKIVAAVCRTVPKQYREVAIGVAQIAPGSAPEVLRAVASVFPELKSGIDHALAGSQGAIPQVAAVLDSSREVTPSDTRSPAYASASVPAGSAVNRGTTFAAPLAPVSNSSNPQPPPHGGRNYASP